MTNISRHMGQRQGAVLLFSQAGTFISVNTTVKRKHSSDLRLRTLEYLTCGITLKQFCGVGWGKVVDKLCYSFVFTPTPSSGSLMFCGGCLSSWTSSHLSGFIRLSRLTWYSLNCLTSIYHKNNLDQDRLPKYLAMMKIYYQIYCLLLLMTA